MNGIEQLLTSNIAAIITTTVFIGYLWRKDKTDTQRDADQQKLFQKRHKEFYRLMGQYLSESYKIVKENTEAYNRLSVQIQKLSDVIQKQ